MPFKLKPKVKPAVPARTIGAPPGARYTMFWPVFVFFIGFGIFTLYQIQSLEDQIDSVTRAIDKMDPRVKRAEYERAKFYTLAKDILRLAPHDANAEQIVAQLNLRQLRSAGPSIPDDTASTNPPDVAPMPPPPAPAPTNASPLGVPAPGQ